ncbi:lysoplasmalogenase TMEM86A [Chironomus tepperi]|uniref:lysoplasmalogenase TMEM86A n=1 Tax=Chironomus tepperi TaxID=113505 RepID=UPI00391EFEBA
MTVAIHNIAEMAKVTGFQLAPFFKSAILYFVFYKFDYYDSNLLSTILKCAPIFYLMIFLLMNDYKEPRQIRHKRFLLSALFFSLIGDIMLDYKAGGEDAFAIGMGSFAVAQIIYVISFGFKPLRLIIGLAFYAVGGSVIAVIFKNFNGIFMIAIPIYSLLLETMVWRACARVINIKSIPQICCALGAVSFIISDCLIAVNMFYKPMHNAQIYIMVTYYLAQLGITLSVLDV